jgi:hypothetical protein
MAIYTSQTISGYNSSPPPDDGSQTGANRTTWSGVKTKLSDPVKTLAEAINTELVAFAGRYIGADLVSKAATFAVATSDTGKMFLCGTGSYTVDLPAASTAGEGFIVGFMNTGSSTIITIDAAGADLINGAATYTLESQYASIWLISDASNWYSLAIGLPVASDANVLNGAQESKAVTPAGLAQIWAKLQTATATTSMAVPAGGYANVSGTTTIAGLSTTEDTSGRRFMFRFTAAVTITHNATTLILPGGQNINVQSGDILEFVSEGSGNWRLCRFLGTDGRPWSRIYESGEQAVSNNTLLSLEHGFGMIPKVVNARLRLTGATGDLSYSVNTEVIFANGMTASGNGASVLTTATAVLISQAGTNLFLHTATGGNAAQITNAQWRWVVTAYA